MLPSTTVYSTSHQVRSKLTHFGASVEQLKEVALAAASGRAEATLLHPANAGGTFSYQHGVAQLRFVFMQISGWDIYQHRGVEGVQNKELGMILLFQNVDRACGIQEPNPISVKGDAITDLVDNPTGYLWPEMQAEDTQRENKKTWFFCVSCSGDDVSAELSRPRAMEKGSFGTFAERIFIVQDSEWKPRDPETEFDLDFDVSITRKG